MATMGEEPAPPVLRRLACERCFSRKYKCDRVLPTCSSCVSHGTECKSRPGHFDNFDETVIIKQSTMFQYVDSLKRKILNLEDKDTESPSKRARLDTTVAQDGRSRDGAACTSTDGSPANVLPTTRRQKRLSVREAMGEIAFLSRSAMAEPRAESDNLPRNLSLYNMIKAALNLTGSDPSTASLPEGRHRLSQTNLRLREDPISLDREGTKLHMQLFADYVCMRYPHLAVDSAMKQYELIIGRENAPRAAEGSVELFNTYLGIAIGALLSPDAPMLSSYVSALHGAAVNELEEIVKRQDTLCIIRCMLLLAIFSLYSPMGGSAWHLTGLIMQRCVFIGLEKDIDPGGQGAKSAAAIERRRLFWSAYILDRNMCIAMGRPFSLRDQDVHVKTLINDEDGPYGPEMALKQYLIHHSRLSSSLGATDLPSSLLADYHNISFLAETPLSLRRLALKPEQLASYMDQLKCRMMTRLMKPILADEGTSTMTTVFTREIKPGIMTACKQFIHRRYALPEDCSIRNSFLDDMDIFCAGVVFAYLSCRRSDGMSCADPSDVFEVLQECSLLLSVSGGQFSTTRAFQKTLLSISKQLRSNPSNATSRHPSIGIPPEMETMIPSHIKKLLEICLQ